MTAKFGAHIPTEAWIVFGLLLAAGFSVMAMGDQWGQSEREQLYKSLREELIVQMRAAAVEVEGAAASRVRESRGGRAAGLAEGEEAFFINYTPGVRAAEPDARLASAEKLEFAENNRKGAYLLYSTIAADSNDAASRVNAARAACRLADPGDEKSRSLQLLRECAATAGRRGRAALLANFELSESSARDRSVLMTDIEMGEYADVVPGERAMIYKKLDGDRAKLRMFEAAAALADADDTSAAVALPGGWLAWRLPSAPDRMELRIVSCAELAAAASPSIHKGILKYTNKPGENSVELSKPFADSWIAPTAAQMALIQTRAEVEHYEKLVSAGTICTFFVFGAFFYIFHARRRKVLADQTNNFLAATTHELKTPLANIRLYAETIGELGAEPVDPTITAQIIKFTKTIVEESDRLNSRISEMLDVAAGRQGVVKSGGRFDPAPILREIVDHYQSSAIASGGALVMDSESAGLLLHGRPELFRRAISAVIENAIKFAPGTPIFVQMRREKNKLIITVDDGGRGVPDSDRERVFEPFVRLGDEMTRSTAGTGLGLTLARQCAEACCGVISMGRGARGGALVRFVFAASS